jgi:hypothetical protein
MQGQVQLGRQEDNESDTVDPEETPPPKKAAAVLPMTMDTSGSIDEGETLGSLLMQPTAKVVVADVLPPPQTPKKKRPAKKAAKTTTLKRNTPVRKASEKNRR